jgi:Family of unknown function (DUF6345)
MVEDDSERKLVMPNTVSVGIGWSTHFPGGGLIRKLKYRRLRYAYRAPAFVAEAMVADGSTLGFLNFDERLKVADLDGTNQALACSVDFLYVASHGEYTSSSTYKLILHTGEWPVSGSDLGAGAPSVAAFDTCDLLDLNDPQWPTAWQTAGSSLRLLLGFASPATVAADSTLRGRVFAEKILAGDPIGPAWLQAVHGNSYLDTDLGVAVGFGDSLDGADWALHDMTLSDLPKPRYGGSPIIEVEACH